jgi:guanylate kinase
MSNGFILVLSAPSGCGKSTILKKVMSGLPGLVFSVSHTTRSPRPGEQDGRDYHFVDRRTFIELRDRQPSGFLEWAEVHGNFYGTSRAEVEARLSRGEDVVLDIDVQGAAQIRQNAQPVTVFVVPPSLDELERRLRGRGTESEESLGLRLANAGREMQHADEYTYCIVNDDLDRAVESLRAIIIAERSRRRRTIDGHPMPQVL